ncbi:MAG: hypothetical protein COW24_06035 [Candidatus Kerfeldbacteria bacterium CG15_BIG_FIL_POST_REV_8_21_14_020_45_12]|uniref:Uncharacterized protein n=1 Tax=Candidatus Kerfeldbacteria bacterium CG15_BIG_FIL_POST_REV_8_21_14_020_45_12 TaxID=2014247 RepID=A0A2M7H225_9BACT|nr:MAG: hypothetical protein COW24_06035 [Candidatus Kerfeldbacteria bacterium CG15_BIG_FIL_POST_REV_8_21_14_020_45_12]PJA92895.1 MAG: hypothetical protein CO132_05875 [Candidatus Kerfeldbacteria bacterium CG_4_9_14_3_um_filter_45_8]
MSQPPAQSGQSAKIRTIQQWEQELQIINDKITDQVKQIESRLESGATAEEIQPLFALVVTLLTSRYEGVLALLNDRKAGLTDAIHQQQVDAVKTEYQERLVTLAALVDGALINNEGSF